MLIAAVGGAMAAAPSVNTETTDTTYTSEITDGDTQAYNATTSSNFSWSADSANSKIVIEQGNDTLYSATPDHEDEASGTYYYNATLADDGSSYDGLEADAGESVTLNVTLINNTEADDPDKTNVSFTFANTITVSVAGTPMADALDASTENTESGDVVWSSAASMDGEYIAVADGEQPDTEWFEDGSTYAVYDSDDKTLTYHNVDERTSEDQQDLELSATGNDGLGIGNTASMLQSYDVSNAWATAVWNADYNEPEWEDVEE